MKKPVQITMPSPCPVKDELLTPIDGGWFCGGCQKKVYDFTNYSDEELARIYKNKEGRCGMFLDSQINRPLGLPKRNNIWIAATAAVMSLLTLGNNKATAQENIQQIKQNNILKPSQEHEQHIIKGHVWYNWGGAVERAKIKIKGTSKAVYTNENGYFTIEAKKGDVIKITAKGCKAHKIIVSDETEISIRLLYRDDSLNKRRSPGYF